MSTFHLSPFNLKLLLFCIIISVMFTGTITASALNGDGSFQNPWVVDNWSELSSKISAGGYIKLSDFFTSGSGPNSQLIILGGVEVTLDLNGKTIDRGMTSASGLGSVMNIMGTLTLEDSVGTGVITGGFSDGQGGGINVSGTLYMRGGKITGNKAVDGGGVYVAYGKFYMQGGEISDNIVSGNGGGVYVIGEESFSGISNGTFNMYGGIISANMASGNGGGIYLNKSGVKFRLSGNPTISGNTVDFSANNVYLANGQKINVTGPLSNKTPVGVTMEKTGVFTSGLSGNGSNINFKSDNSIYAVVKGSMENMELSTYNLCTITLNNNSSPVLTYSVQNSIIDTPTTINKPTEWTNGDLPFLGWNTLSNGMGTYFRDGSQITPTGGALTLYAQWGPVAQIGPMTYDTLQDAFDAAGENQTVQLLVDIDTLEKAGSFPLVITNTFALDLNGHDINRGLENQQPVENGNVITVNGGNLTLMDNVGSGKITGGNISNSGGGGIEVYYSGSLIMNGGTISGNHTRHSGGGVMIAGGCSFTMNKGTISGNSADYGGGVYLNNDVTFIMINGTISDNYALHGGGGIGIFAFSNFVMRNGMISNNESNKGGGVDAYIGTFEMYGGQISDNIATEYGGGVSIEKGAVSGTHGDSIEKGFFAIEGGTISGNMSHEGGGVSIKEGTFHVKGSPVITGNKTDEEKKNNVNLSNAYITVTGEMGNTALIGISITGANTGVFTDTAASDLDYNSAVCFTSDDSAYAVGKYPVDAGDDVGQLFLGEPVTITYKSNYVVVREINEIYTVGSSIKVKTINEAGFTDTESIFLGWNTNADGSGMTYTNGAEITLTDDLTLFAQWAVAKITVGTGNTATTNYYTTVQAAFDAVAEGSESKTVDLLTNIYSRTESFPIIVTAENEVILNLNGKSINTVFYEPKGISAFTINGKLTLTDYSNGTAGMITGFNYGVQVNTDGEFIMEKGTITSESVGLHIGVSVASNSIFTMNGGIIRGNYTGVEVRGIFTMNDGATITENNGGAGVRVSNGTFIMNNGAVITKNSVNGVGGGVFINGEFIMNEGAMITENNATTDGAGVFIDRGTFTMNGGDISENSAGNRGGGVHVYPSATFNLNGGSISDNSADTGGGVYVYYDGQVNIFKGMIQNNTAESSGGGVYIMGSDASYHNAGTINISGPAQIINNNNNNVYLSSTSFGQTKINISGPLELNEEKASIGVTLQNKGGVFTETQSSYLIYNDASRFISDDNAYMIINNADGQLFLGIPVIVSGISAKNKVYDGTRDADLDTASVKFNGETISGLFVNASGTFDNKNVETEKNVTINGLTLTGTNASKYFLASSGQQSITTANITPKPIAVTVITKNRDYEAGNTEVKISGGAINSGEIIPGDNVNIDLNGVKCTMSDDTAGTGKAVTVTGISLGGSDAENYYVEQPTDVTVTINKKEYTGIKEASILILSDHIMTDAILTLPLVPPGTTCGTSIVISSDLQGLLNGIPVISGTALIFSTTAKPEGTQAVINIGVSGGKNYYDYQITATITVENARLLLPSGLKSVGESAFEGSNTFNEVVLPGTLTSIGSRAFANCAGLRLVRVPDSVTTITEDAFDGTDNLIFYCSSDNTGAAYAREHGIPYQFFE